MWFRRENKNRNRRLGRGHVLDVKLRSDQVRANRMRLSAILLSVVFGTFFGLYLVWRSGELLLDGTPVEGERFEEYRSLITAIFPDFHLFQRLYGIDDPDPAELTRMLTEFKLQAKTRLNHGEFQTTDLSSGQRRRLALIVAQLEKRPLLMLDEWAADQDPEFRRKFYFEFLPALHRAGITVVAISHDDRYIDEMDVPIRRLRMDEGRFTELSSVETG